MPTQPTSQNQPWMRKAFVMAVAPGQAEEYASRHNPIWPELTAVLKSHGVHNYSIFYHPTTRQLFAYVEVEDQARWDAIAQTEVCQKWWQHMGDIMPTNDDHSPASTNLQQVFFLE